MTINEAILYHLILILLLINHAIVTSGSANDIHLLTVINRHIEMDLKNSVRKTYNIFK